MFDEYDDDNFELEFEDWREIEIDFFSALSKHLSTQLHVNPNTFYMEVNDHSNNYTEIGFFVEFKDESIYENVVNAIESFKFNTNVEQVYETENVNFNAGWDGPQVDYDEHKYDIDVTLDYCEIDEANSISGPDDKYYDGVCTVQVTAYFDYNY